MPNNYATIAKNIIGNSIKSVVYVDDALAIPFEVSATEGEKQLSKEMFHSFYQHNCSIDMYKYVETEKWHTKAEYFFKGRDLFIVDWQLNKTEPEYAPTLEILSAAIKKESLHFICIYTSTKSEEFENIIYKLNSYFSPFVKDDVTKDMNQISKLLEDAGYEIKEVFTSEILTLLKEMVIYPERAGESFQSINKAIAKNTSEEIAKQIKAVFASRYKNILLGFCSLGFMLNGEELNPNPSIYYQAKNFVKQNFLIINHTIILIANKKDIQPSLLYEKYSEAVIKSSGNFLTLMGLEMRNHFKESSAFIGNDIDSINELAFFHHQQNAKPSEAFYDFLKDLWKAQAASFLHNGNSTMTIFGALDDYKETNKINEQLVLFSSSSQANEQHLGKLNYYYNILSTSRPKNDQLRFGDIFRILDENFSPTADFLICITAHCDCLYPSDKINNMFYFVKGTKGNLAEALKVGDTAFNSYILDEKNKVNIINWQDKPFTLYIPPSNNNIESKIPITIADKKFVLGYHSTLKENYAQRIANRGFTYPLHVGIFFSDTKNNT
ncbi:MAG TPA: response regulator receiver domain [Bacteroidia bacterium]|nr:response regulator receiver domain [Bacteroidia bacterium]